MLNRQIPNPDGRGNDVKPLETHLHQDVLGAMQRAAVRAVSFAQDFVEFANELEPGQRREPWDRAAQFAFHKAGEFEPAFLQHNITLAMEKGGGVQIDVEYSPHVFKSKNSAISRPDGVLIGPGGVVALELDHGKTINDWLAKLMKASRSALSHRISSVLYVYGTPRDQEAWFLKDELTEEFYRSIEWASLKSLGLITVGQRDVEESGVYPESWKEELKLEWSS